mgnify:CR=1 FL=1
MITFLHGKLVEALTTGVLKPDVPAHVDHAHAESIDLVRQRLAGLTAEWGLNDVILSGVVFNVNATNVILDRTAFYFYNKADSSVKTACNAYNSSGIAFAGTNSASGSFLVDCRFLQASSVDTRIPSGATATYVLEGSITNPKTSTSTSGLQASIQNFSSLSSTLYSVGTATTNSHIDWIDADAGTLTTTNAYFRWVEYPDTSIKSTSYKS